MFSDVRLCSGAQGLSFVRIALYDHPRVTLIRITLFTVGGALVFGYAVFLNLAPLEFREVVGLYIATLFIVWKVINFVFFRTLPTPPILIGGTMIVIGGLVVSLWPK
jgi:small multidrug resistance family-3 protein